MSTLTHISNRYLQAIFTTLRSQEIFLSLHDRRFLKIEDAKIVNEYPG